MSVSEEATTTTSEGRDSRGRFTKNNKGGPGNPYSRQVARLRQVMLECVPEEVLRTIVAALTQQALAGDVAAARLILQYTLGKPIATVHPDRVDIDEVQTYQAGAFTTDDLMPTLLRVPADVASDLMRKLMPVMSDLATQDLQALGQKLQAESATPHASQGQATVSKREQTEQRQAPLPPETEAIRLINLPVSKRHQTDQRVANKRQP